MNRAGLSYECHGVRATRTLKLKARIFLHAIKGDVIKLVFTDQKPITHTVSKIN
jgi:hypothetical protein